MFRRRTGCLDPTWHSYGVRDFGGDPGYKHATTPGCAKSDRFTPDIFVCCALLNLHWARR